MRASVAVLAEGLTRAGRDLSRAKLIEEFEGLHEFQTMSGSVTFGPNQRLATLKSP